ncbi:hypothetical protein JXB01_04830 [Candidatus Micrarchaeota archaeon]|nr:hypothetical protein [Candidatus Micrarchaeota archaeon]
MMENRLLVWSSLIGGILALLLSFLYGSSLLAFFAALLFFLSILLWKYGYLIVPMITQHTNIVELRDSYEVVPARDIIIKRTDKGYYASKFMEIRFYESTLDKEKREVKTLFESFEKAILSLRNIVKISLLISAIDLSKQLDEIKTKRSIAESRKSKLKPNSDDAVRLEREIAMWNRKLDRFSKGERSLELIAYASTTSFGLTKDEAVTKVKRQAKEVSTVLSSTLGCEVHDLIDTEMLKCFEWDLFFPSSSEELRDSLV